VRPCNGSSPRIVGLRMDFLLLALPIFGLGALHALEPGHGKTVVAAYLIGSKGRVSDAVLLGLIVTLTHSGSVILLGVLSTVAAAYFVPETVQKVLEIVSGLLVLAVGLWMLLLRDRSGHDHGHMHPHAAELEDQHGHVHASQEFGDAHAEAHDHPHPHPHGSHGHDHTAPVATPGKRPGLGQLVALGISGGIVPCPAALAVLLAAISLGAFLRGLSLVIIFSIGMATVLVAIGIMMVKAAGFAARYVQEPRWVRLAPRVSAVVITLLGLGLTVKAALHLM
jgi:nickel/cobalt transporter (NicO) family protein